MIYFFRLLAHHSPADLVSIPINNIILIWAGFNCHGRRELEPRSTGVTVVVVIKLVESASSGQIIIIVVIIVISGLLDMENAASVSSNPRTVDEVFRDFRGRRTAIIRALTTDVDRFFSLCDPDKENLCLYGYANESWDVNLPAEEVPPELPEPALGINFARDGMQRKDWLSLVSVHSDAWLIAVAFYHGARFNRNERKRLYSMMNDLPTVFEVITEKHSKDKTNSDNSGSKPKSSGKRMNDGQIKNSKPPVKDEEETYEDDEEEHSDTICGICDEIYSPTEFWIGCDSCERWYHGRCVKVSSTKANTIKEYKCPRCTSKKVR